MVSALPIRDSYVIAERLLGGAYPGTDDLDATRDRLARFETYGVTLFVDLTEPGELPPYAPVSGAARRERLPVPDRGLPEAGEMRAILDLVDAELERGGTVYVHCRGGIGRTGTVAGCWLRRHGLDGGDPLATLAELRADVPDAWMPSPETREQAALVTGWPVGE